MAEYSRNKDVVLKGVKNGAVLGTSRQQYHCSPSNAWWNPWTLFRKYFGNYFIISHQIGKFAKIAKKKKPLWQATTVFAMSVRPFACKQLGFPLHGFSLNFISWVLSENLSRSSNFNWNLTRIKGTSQMKRQLDATLCRFYFYRVTLHVSGASAHHQEYLKTSTAATGTCVIVAGKSSHLPVHLHVPVAAVLVFKYSWWWALAPETCRVTL